MKDLALLATRTADSMGIARAEPVSYPVVPPCDLEAIYRDHVGLVGRWVAYLGGPDVDVEDVVHEVFLVVHRRLAEFRGEAKITSWLYEITTRVARNARRKERLKRWLRRVRFVDVARGLAPSHVTPVDELERRQARESVHATLDRLPEKYRTVLILFEIEELSGEEIARLTGIKPSTVFVRLHRARHLFLACLEKSGGARDG
jgi:RNA polymerase sigma-70 factor (ECF subfamily)